MSEMSQTVKEAELKAAEEGLDVLYPELNELFIDLDTEEDYEIFKKRYESFKTSSFEIEDIIVRPSRSGLPKRHVIIRLVNDIEEIERIALQAILNSDPVRELFSLTRYWNGESKPTLFFEKKRISDHPFSCDCDECNLIPQRF